MGGVHFSAVTATGTTMIAPGDPTTGGQLPAVAYGAFGRLRFGDEVSALFVLRESSLSAHHELASLASVVLGRHSYREGLADLGEAGLTPLREPGRWGGHRVEVAEGTASLVQVGQSWVLYALTSAAKDSEGGINPFTRRLVDMIRELRPQVVITGSMSRLVRHENHASDLVRAFTDVKPILECAEKTINFRGNPQAASDFFELATHAIRDRAYIVSRLEDGRVAAANQGNYPFQEATLPLGYRRSRKRKIILSERRQQEALQRAFTLLSDSSVSVKVVASGLVASKAFTARKAGRGTGKRKPLSLKLAEKWVHRLIDRVDTWETGVHTFTHVSSGTSAHMHFPDSVDGRVKVIYEFGLPLPAGGWAPREVFAAIRERSRNAERARHRSKQATAEKHRHQLPLAGYTWRDGASEYYLSSRTYKAKRDSSRYMLSRRPVADQALHSLPGDETWERSMSRPWGHPSVTSPVFVCLIAAAALHRSVASVLGSLDQFEFNESARALTRSPGRADTRREESAAIDAELASAQRMKMRARELVYSADAHDPMRAEYETDYREAVENIERLKRDADELKERALVETSTDEPWAVTPGAFLAALARLHDVPGPLPRPVVKALHAVLTGLTVEYDRKRGEVAWSLRLRLPTITAAGERTTEPLGGRLPILPARRSQMSLAHREESSLRRYMEDVRVDPDLLPFASAGLRARGLVESGAAHALLGSPLTVRATVIAHLLGDPAPEGVDPEWASVLLDAYRSGRSRQREWNEPARDRQAVLDYLSANGPTLLEDLGVKMNLRSNARTFDALIRDPDGTWFGVTTVERFFVESSRNDGQRVRVSLRTCPHCGGKVDIVARVRECPTGLLCSACLRMPTCGSPEFPEVYRSLAARPQARNYVTRAEPDWWKDLRRAHATYPDSAVTTLASSLGRPRHEVREACEALGLQVRRLGSIAADWTDERLRVEYIDRDRKLIDLAFELGVSTGTLTKRLRAAGIRKHGKGKALVA